MVWKEALNFYFFKHPSFLSPLLSNLASSPTDLRFILYHNKRALNYTQILFIDNSDHTVLIIKVSSRETLKSFYQMQKKTERETRH